MPLPSVEVLMGTCNSATYIEPMLHSLISQTFVDFTLVVSDDMSTDSTVEIIRDYSSQFKLPIRLQVRESLSGGARANYNDLLLQSRADYVFLADHDDVWLPHKMERQLSLLEQAEKANGTEIPVLAHSDLTVIDSAGTEVHPSFWNYKQIEPSAGAVLPSALMHATVTGCASAMNRALVECSVPVPPEAVMHDWWLNLVAAARGKVVWQRTPLIQYRLHSGNVSRPRRVDLVSSFAQLDRVKAARNNIEQRYRQGRALHSRLKDVLSPEQEALLREFGRLPAYPPVLRQIRMIQHGFTWPGIWRNVVQLPFA